MKKMIIAATVAMLGIAVNAASVQWSVGNNGATDMGGTTLAKGSTIYFVLASATDDITAAINDGTFSATTAGVLGSGTTTNTRGRTDVTPVTSSVLSLNSDGTGVETAFRVLVFDTTTNAGETWYKFSGEGSVATYDESAATPVPTTITFTGTHWANGTAWTQVAAVPEPTSALLLLLGVAGLALKRKVA